MKDELPEFQSNRLFMDRALKWLLKHPTHLEELFKILVPDIAKMIDFNLFEKLDSSFISEEFHEKESDALFKVGLKAPQNAAFIYVLFEHQSQPDRWITYRFFQANSLIWRTISERQKATAEEISLPLVIPLLIYTGTEVWQVSPLWESMGVSQKLRGFVPSQEILFLGIHMEGAKKVMDSPTGIGACFSLLKAVDSEREKFEQELFATHKRLEKVYSDNRDNYVWDLRLLVGAIFHKRPGEEIDELYENLRSKLRREEDIQEAEKMKKTWADTMMEKGEEKGRIKGKQEDIIFGLQIRFGEVPEELRNKIQEVKSLARLHELLALSYNCRDLEEFETGLG